MTEESACQHDDAQTMSSNDGGDEVVNFADDQRSSSRCSVSNAPTDSPHPFTRVINQDYLPPFSVAPSSMMVHAGSSNPDPNESDSPSLTARCYLWASGLENVLEDYEGLELFKEFLEDECCVFAIYFHFAVMKVLKPMYNNPNETEKSRRQCVDYIYQRFLSNSPHRASQPLYQIPHCVDEGCRKRVTDEVKLLSKQVQHEEHNTYPSYIFDEVHSQVWEFLQRKHQVFAQSDMYVHYVNKCEDGDGRQRLPTAPPLLHDDSCDIFDVDSPRVFGGEASITSSSSTSTSDDRVQPTAMVQLPAVKEESPADTTLTLQQKSPLLQQQQQQPPPLPPKQRKERGGPKLPQKPLRPSAAQSSAKSASGGSSKKVALLTEQALSSTIDSRNPIGVAPVATTSKAVIATNVVPNPYHTDYVPQCPPSMKESAVSSAISSEASGAKTGSGEGKTSRSERHQMHANRVDQMRRNTNAKQFLPRTMQPSNNRLKGPDPSSNNREERVRWFELLKKKLQDVENEEVLTQVLPRLAGLSKSDRKAAVKEYSAHCEQQQRSKTTVDDDAMAVLDGHMRIFEGSSASSTPAVATVNLPPPPSMQMQMQQTPPPYNLVHPPPGYRAAASAGRPRKSPKSRSPERRLNYKSTGMRGNPMTNSLPPHSAYLSGSQPSTSTAHSRSGAAVGGYCSSAAMPMSMSTMAASQRPPRQPQMGGGGSNTIDPRRAPFVYQQQPQTMGMVSTRVRYTSGPRSGMHVSDTSGIGSDFTNLSEPPPKPEDGWFRSSNDDSRGKRSSKSERRSSKTTSGDKSSLSRRSKRLAPDPTATTTTTSFGFVDAGFVDTSTGGVDGVEGEKVQLVFMIPSEREPFLTEVVAQRPDGVTFRQVKQVTPNPKCADSWRRYYFKTMSDAIDPPGPVFQEIVSDGVIVPLYDGKIVVKVEK